MAQKPSAAPSLLVWASGTDRQLDSGSEYRIGRDPAADIVVSDDRVSWRHATLRADGQSWVLEDEGSSNGTYVDGERIDRVEIRQHRLVRLGNPANGPELRFEPQLSSGAGPEPEPGPAGPGVSDLPSVDRRPTSRIPLTAELLRIGRAPDNDLVVSDLSVSRKHAVLRKSHKGRYEIFDLDSYNGTYVNGAREQQAEISEEDIIGIGHATFRLADGELREYIDTGDVSLEARDLTVVLGGKTLVEHVSFPIGGRSLVAVIGPSGAGKSTLLRALSGMRPADTGNVLYDNRDLYRDFAELRHRIGFVPQKDIVHTLLSSRTALGYAAEFRFPSDTRKDERANRVDEVLDQLSLTDRADAPAKELSGGQQKRVNVALELLTKPSLLFLDEPTSGLDPGLDAQFMEQMRDLAHENDGRTIIVVTHSVENLHTCDRLLVLVRGGKVAYYGPPQDALAYFGQSRWADVFRAFEEKSDRDWAGEFRQSREYARRVVSPMIAHTRTPRPHRQSPVPPSGRGWGRQLHTLTRRCLSWGRQLHTLTRRYVRLIAAERLYLWLIVLAPFLLGYFVRLSQTAPGLNVTGASGPSAEETLLVLMITACLAGVFNSIREVVKERDIFDREHAAGLSAGAYLTSKVLVLGVIAIYQAVVMTAIGVLKYPLPASGSWLTHYPFIELCAATAFLELASTYLGLLVSTLVPTSDLAMQVLILPVMIQLVFSGGFFTLSGVFSPLSTLVPGRWGFAALASTVNLNVPNKVMGMQIDPRWAHSSSAWLTAMAAMLAWSAVYILLAWWQLTRRSPGRRKEGRRLLRFAISR